MKEKNLLLKEQILFFKGWPHLGREAKMEMAELQPLKMCPIDLNFWRNVIISLWSAENVKLEIVRLLRWIGDKCTWW